MRKVNGIDVAKGLVIFLMVIANYSSYYIQEPNVFFRLIYTISAPLFVFLSGYLAYSEKIKNNYPQKYYITRGIILLIVAGLVDLLCYQIYPLSSFNILYLLGFSALLFPILYSIHNKFRYSIFFIFLLSFVLQKLWGYDQELVKYKIYHQLNFVDFFSITFKQSLISGYFPIFPWLGIFMLGFLFYEEKYKIFISKNGYFSIFLFPVISFWLISSEKYIRGGCAQLFYPPDYVFIIWVINLAVLTFYILYNKIYIRMGLIGKYLESIGKPSLFFYVFHLFLGEYFLRHANWSNLLFRHYFLYFEIFFNYFITFTIIGLLGLIFDDIRKRNKNLSLVGRIFIGV